MRFPHGRPVSILLHAEFGPNDHREDVPHFRLCDRVRTHSTEF